MEELRLEARHTHLYPGLRGTVIGRMPRPADRRGRTCLVAFSDGSAALATLTVETDVDGVLEAGAYTTAAGTPIPEKRWRIELSCDHDGPRHFRVRAKL